MCHIHINNLNSVIAIISESAYHEKESCKITLYLAYSHGFLIVVVSFPTLFVQVCGGPDFPDAHSTRSSNHGYLQSICSRRVQAASMEAG